TRVRMRRLSELMQPYPATLLPKGPLDEECILIELDDIESLTGRLLTEDRVVTQVGSSKVVFGDCDLLVGKLRPYLGTWPKTSPRHVTCDTLGQSISLE
ncbi:MAG: hypothetical protein WBB22_17965, partial [Anaerolineae bacterium]